MDAVDYSRFVFGLFAVLAMIGLAGIVARKLGLAPNARPKGTEKRLSLIESLTLDARRRLVIVRRDNVEHLLVLGVNGETVVESDIRSREFVVDTEDFEDDEFVDLGEDAPTDEADDATTLLARVRAAFPSRARTASGSGSGEVRDELEWGER